MTTEELLEIHRKMVLLRVFDEKCVALHRQGRIAPVPRFSGHEAIEVGSCHALDGRDWIFPSYRESQIGALRGMPLAVVLAQWQGHPAGWWNPHDYRVASVSIPVGSHIPHAVGCAWGLKLKGEEACAVAYFGDGATSEGAFHEGATFAGALQVPVVLLCNNNGWAISTPVARQTGAEQLVNKAVGYGIRGIRVDGGDVIEIIEATREALTHARAGDGPTLIEAVSQRVAPHAMADDERLYRSAAEIERAREQDCLLRFERHLCQAGLLDKRVSADHRLYAETLVKLAVEDAETLTPPDEGEMFDTVYASPPPTLARSDCPFLAGLPA
jgi:pyruvate dehydrogenase E1 component alpha subunit